MKSFNENSDKQFLKSIKDLEKEKRNKGYVLDLKNNPGGLLTQAINITDFLDEGEIVSTKGKFLKLENFLRNKEMKQMVNQL